MDNTIAWAGRPLVDGVFVPNGGKNAVQVDSAGHACDEFPGTANTTWQYIWAGGQLRDEGVPTKLDDVDYASPGHGLLYFNGNNAPSHSIWKPFGGRTPVASCCDSAPSRQYRARPSSTVTPTSGCWWTVSRGSAAGRSEVLTAHIRSRCRSAQSDRFLTLAATDGGDGIRHDWIIFGDPRLELLPAALSAGSPPEQGAAEH